MSMEHGNYEKDQNENRLSPEEVERWIEKVESFVERNIARLPEDPASCNKCIDGRPSKFPENETCENGEKPAAFPGADLGAAMLLLEQGFSAEEALQSVLDFLGEKGYVFNFHSDTHHKEEGHGAIGCGHANASIMENDHYAFPREEAERLIQLVYEEVEKGNPQVREDVLVGDHGEQAILVVEDPKESVRHTDPETGEQYFVYDRYAHRKYIQELAEFLKRKGIQVNEEDLLRAAERQADATLALLSSSRGKPMFLVSFDQGESVGENVHVSYLGNAPQR